MYIKSPFNYIGNKYRLLPQILPLFPEKCNVFYDVFCGGLDVSVNVRANKKVANDINHFLIEIMEFFKFNDYGYILKEIEQTISKYNLAKDNKESYYKFRDYYNKNKNPIYLYVLMCYSFNYQFRFNSKLDYNNPSGTNRSSFNRAMQERLYSFIETLDTIEFHNCNFKEFDYSIITKDDFVYCDPPYRTSVGSYNDGKRGFEGWGIEDDLALFEILDSLDARGVKFALSNVFFNNGFANQELAKWSEKYNVYTLKVNYSNSNYQRKKCFKTREVLITNYKGD